MVQRKPFMLWVGCGNEQGSTNRWSIFVEAEQGFLQKIFRNENPLSLIAELENQLEDIVRKESDFKDIELGQD